MNYAQNAKHTQNTQHIHLTYLEFVAKAMRDWCLYKANLTHYECSSLSRLPQLNKMDSFTQSYLSKHKNDIIIEINVKGKKYKLLEWMGLLGSWTTSV